MKWTPNQNKGKVNPFHGKHRQEVKCLCVGFKTRVKRDWNVCVESGWKEIRMCVGF